MERLFTGTKRGGKNLQHKKQRRGKNFPQCLYGNQQVPVAAEKKWSLSYEREKERPTPLLLPRASVHPLFSCTVAKPTPAATVVAAKRSLWSSCNEKRDQQKTGRKGERQKKMEKLRKSLSSWLAWERGSARMLGPVSFISKGEYLPPRTDLQGYLLLI